FQRFQDWLGHGERIDQHQPAIVQHGPCVGAVIDTVVVHPPVQQVRTDRLQLGGLRGRLGHQRVALTRQSIPWFQLPTRRSAPPTAVQAASATSTSRTPVAASMVGAYQTDRSRVRGSDHWEKTCMAKAASTPNLAKTVVRIVAPARAKAAVRAGLPPPRKRKVMPAVIVKKIARPTHGELIPR